MYTLMDFDRRFSTIYNIYRTYTLSGIYREPESIDQSQEGFPLHLFYFFLCAVFVSATSDRRMKKTEEQRNKKYQTEREREREITRVYGMIERSS